MIHIRPQLSSTRGALALLPLGLALSACLSPSAVTPLRLFEPPAPEVAAVDATGVALVLAPLSSAGSVEARFAWRLSPVELAFDDIHRWVDHPRVFVERALRAEWFGSGAFAEQMVTSGNAREVAVTVSAFEVARTGSQGAATIELALRVLGPNGIASTIVRAEARGEGDPPAMARAMGQALADAARRSRLWLTEQHR